MTTQHTPGPWACTYTSNHAHDYRLSRINGPLPLTVIANDHSEQHANARLISAAPDLLTAAQAMADSFADCVKTELALSEFPALAALVAAIAKAKGQ